MQNTNKIEWPINYLAEIYRLSSVVSSKKKIIKRYKMTLRCRVACTICEQNYLMRISLGHSDTQEHVIECNNCKSSIHIELQLNSSPSFKINYLENCQEANFKDEGLFGTVQKSVSIG